MKTKKLSKKLGLNKNTIANLNTNDMSMIRGGAENTDTCNCPGTECCPTAGS